MRGRNPYAISTIKLREEDLLRAAKEADARAQADEAVHGAHTKRPASTYPEIIVSFEPEGTNIDLDSLLRGTDNRVPEGIEETPEVPSDHSNIRPTWRSDEGPAGDSVPCVVVAKDDLSWFELEPAAEVVLSSIDGAASVQEIADRLTIPREHTLSILRELASHGVIEFH